jgi:hypothetical protein
VAESGCALDAGIEPSRRDSQSQRQGSKGAFAPPCRIGCRPGTRWLCGGAAFGFSYDAPGRRGLGSDIGYNRLLVTQNLLKWDNP